MKKIGLILFIIFFSACTRRVKPSYHFGQTVEVTRGFYEGCSGNVTHIQSYPGSWYVSITKVKCSSGMTVDSIEVDAKDLQ